MDIKRNILLGVGISVLIVLGYLFLYEPEYSGLISAEEKTLVFAHRGFGNHAPDNSLVGAQIALREGLDGVDVDAQFSSDKEIVIFHDVSLERFTDGEGRVDQKTTEELKTYDLGEKYGNGFTYVYISTFEEFVAAVTPSSMLMVELKVATAKDTGIERRTIEILSKYDAFERVYVSSFNPVVLWRLKNMDPRVRTVFIFMDSGWDPKRVAETKAEDRVALPWYLQNEYTRTAIRKIIRPDALSINYGVRESTIDSLLNKGYPIFLWSLNDTESLEWALEKEPYGIVTDEPLLGRDARNSAKN